ncbi:MAG: BirA family transcriptional regulator [Verrucomicrobiota bacterium]|jgi:BirA family biotin operon repressor/biotin-[acetyl-CoA-carboxylase] ligase
MSAADPSDRLVADELCAALGKNVLGNQIVVVEETPSTNDLVWAAAELGEAEGFIAFAERQTAGRGQYGRRWVSAPHCGLWFSILLRPRIAMNESPLLTSLLAGAIAATIIAETGCAASIEPPNDIYVGERKIAGVLVEGRTASDGSYLAVAGMGVNVNQTAADFPAELQSTAGSLRMVTGVHVPRVRLAVALLRKLESDYRAFQAGLVARNC